MRQKKEGSPCGWAFFVSTANLYIIPLKNLIKLIKNELYNT